VGDSRSLLMNLLAYAWAPSLVAAGFIDWALHRHQRIERTAGLRESLLHLLMIAMIGTGLLAAMLLDTTASVLVLLSVVVLLHEACYLADLHVAPPRRQIPLAEQWVHGFQHLLPWAGLAGVAARAPEQTRALLGRPDVIIDWSWRWAEPMPSPIYVAALLGTALVLNIAPFAEESWRCLRVRQRERRG
jgi:hypothetical protein